MRENTIKISIIIPIYNVDRYLYKCLESCVNQSLSGIEVIAIDDCSTDGSASIIDEFERRYPSILKRFKTPCNSRQGAARNIGIKNAQGEYLCFVDGDDYIDSTMCEDLYSVAKENNADAVFCDGYMCRGDNKEYHVQMESWHVENKILQRFTSQCYQIIRKKIIVDNELFFPEKIFCEDTSVAPLWLVCSNNATKVNYPYYYQVLHEDSTTSTMLTRNAEDIMNALELLVQNSKKLDLYDTYKSKIDAFIFSRMICYAVTLEKENYLFDEKKYCEVKERWRNYQFDTTLFNRYFSLEKIRLVEKWFSRAIIQSSDNELIWGNDPILIKKLKQYNGQLVIAGAGKRGKELATLLLENDIKYLVCDSDIRKNGNCLVNTGDTIRSIEQIKNEAINPLFLVSSHIYFESIKKSLEVRDDKVVDFWRMVQCAEYELIK